MSESAPETAVHSAADPEGWQPPRLAETVAVVTGASRGVGRGIALALGAAGATVYVTGRSSRTGDRTEGLPGTVEDVAEEITARGGTGIAVRCDHTSDADNLERRSIRAEGGIPVAVAFTNRPTCDGTDSSTE